MRELSPDEYMTKLERQFRLRLKLKEFFAQAAVSLMMTTGSYGADIVYNEIKKPQGTDTLPQN